MVAFCRLRVVAFTLFAAAVFPTLASAATADFRVLFDVDNNVATGCAESGLAAMAGVDQVLITRVVTTATTAQVTRMSLITCTAGVFGLPVDLDPPAPRPAGLHAPSGSLLIESRIPFSALGFSGMPHGMRIGFDARDTLTNFVHRAYTKPNLAPIIFPPPPATGRVHAVRNGGNRLFVLDGLDPDWEYLDALLNGFAESGSAAVRLLRVFAYATNADDAIYFRFDAFMEDSGPFAYDDNYSRRKSEGVVAVDAAAGVLRNDGPDIARLSASLVSTASEGVVTFDPDGSFTYTPNDPLIERPDSFKYKNSDGSQESNVAKVTIKVSENETPVAQDVTAHTEEDTTVTIMLSGSDGNGDSLTFSIVPGSGPSPGTLGAIISTGPTTATVDYTPLPNFYGPVSFKYTANDGTDDSNPAEVKITVGSVNDAPEMVDGTFTIPENSPNGTFVGTVLAGDVDGSPVFSITAGNTGGAFAIHPSTGTITVANVLALDFETTPVFNLTIRAQDADGLFVTATYTINLTDTGEPPVVTAGATLNYVENAAPAIIDNTITVSDPDSAQGQSATVSITNNFNISQDVLTFTPAGAITGSYNAGTGVLSLSGADSFANYQTVLRSVRYNNTSDNPTTGPRTVTWQVSDGAFLSAPVTSTINITPVNDPPVATADGYSVAEGGTLSVPAPGVLTNDTDPDNAFTAILVSGPANASSFGLNANGSFNYTHNGSETSSDSFTYKANDGTADSSTVTVTITITPVNDAPVAVADSGYNVNEGGTITNGATVLGNDTDAESNPLTAILVSGPANASSFTLDADGTFDYTHNGSETTSDSFTYKANDGTSDSNTVTVSIVINPVNDAPVAVANSGYNVNEGGTITNAATVLANDTDAENNPLTAILVSGPANASSFTLDADGTFDYTHNGSETTSDSFTYKANDGSLDSNTVTVSIVINPINDAPVAVADSGYNVNEGGTITNAATVLANDTDAETNPLTAILVSGPANASSFTLDADGTFDYIHNGGETTSDSFTYKANDGTSDSNTVTVSILINPVNDAPVAVADSGYNVNEGGTITNAATVLANDTDAETNPLTAILVSGPANASSFTLDADGTFDYTHNGGETTSDSFTYKANDGTADSNTVTVSIVITPVNDPPVAVADSGYNVNEGGTITNAATVLGNDTDAETNPLTAILVSGPANASSFTLDADGTFDYTHNGGETTSDSFTYKANDGSADSNTVTVSIVVNAVNDPPVAVADSGYNVNEGGTITNAATVLGNDTDAETNPLTAILVSGPANASSFTLDADGTFDYTHNGGETTSDSFTYKANDGTSDSNTVTVSIVINPVNDPPVAVADSGYNVNEGGTITNAASVLGNDSDPDSPITAILVSGPANASSFTLDADGTFDYTHNGSETTSDSFTYKANDGFVDSNTVTVSVVINPVNDPPVTVADSYNLISVNTLSPAAPGVLVNDTDAELNTLNAILVIGPSEELTFTFNSDGSFTYQHDDSGPHSPTDSFTYKANDGTVDGNTVTVTINITYNQPPVGVNDSYTVTEGLSNITPDASLVANGVLANDTDAELDPKTAVLVTGPLHASSFTLNADGTFSYTHDGTDTGNDSFTYRPSDAIAGQGNLTTVTITVTPVNDSPVAVADSYGVNEAGTLNVNTFATGVLNNDSDEESANTSLTAILVTGPLHESSFTLNADGTFSYTHDGTNTGNDSFTYRANDGNSNSGDVSVTINVTPINDAPVANNDSYNVNEGATLNVITFATGVINSDTDEESANTSLTASLVSGPANSSSFTLNSNGTFSYTHNGTETTTDSFTYKVSDGLLDSNTATVNITVAPQNDAPAITSANTATVPENTTTVITVTSTDPDGGAPSYSVTGGADQLKFSFSGAILSFISAPDFDLPGDANGDNQYIVQVTVNDGAGGITNQTITVTVTNVDEAPVFNTAAAHNVPENTTAVVTVDADDPEGATVTYAKTGGADAAFFSLDTNTGALAFISAPDFENKLDAGANNVYDVQVTATDQTAHSTIQNIAVTVTDVNEPPSFTSATSNSIPENTTAAQTVTATDPDAGATQTYSIVPGDDASKFSIGTSSGALTFNVAPNYEAANDVGGTANDNIYVVTVQVTDGTNPVNQTISITVTNVNEAPVASPDTYNNVIGNTQHRIAGGVAGSSAVAFHTHATNPLANDTDPDTLGPPSFNTITASVVNDSITAQGGRASIEADGSITYDPPAGYVGNDSWTYNITDGTNNVTSQANWVVSNMVWYVKNDAPAGPPPFANMHGTSRYPFNELSDAGADANADDAEDASTPAVPSIVYVFEGNGTTSGQNVGFVMDAGQQLLGQAVDLVANAVTLVTGSAADRPFIGNPAAGGNAVTITSVSNVAVRGLDISANTNAIDATTAVALGASSMTFSDNRFSGAGVETIDVNPNAGTTGTLTLTIANNTWTGTHSNNGIDVQQGANAGTVNVNVSNNTGITTGQSGIILFKGTGTAVMNVTGLADNTVGGNTGGAGVYVKDATFDAVPLGGIDQVDGNNMVIGADGNGTTLGALILENTGGNLYYDDLEAYSDQIALNITGVAGMTFGVDDPGVGGSSILKSTGNAALTVSNAAIDLRLADLESTTSGSGVTLASTSGQFSAPSGSFITKSSGAGTGISVSNSSVTVNYGGTMNVTSGNGVVLTTNTGAVNFTGQLTLNTGTLPAFAATGAAGTVTATNTASTLQTTTATALNVNGPDIGAGGLHFQSINANGGSNGIIIQDTGVTGGLTVYGTGAAGSGGTIQNISARGLSFINARGLTVTDMNFTNANTADGAVSNGTVGGNENTDENGAIHLSSSANVNLTDINITGTTTQHGINGNNVTNLDLTNVSISNTGTGVWESGIYLFHLKGVPSASQDSVWTNVDITDTAQFNVSIINASGTNAAGGEKDKLSIPNGGSTFANSGKNVIGDHISIFNSLTANFQVDVNTATFTSKADGEYPGAHTSDGIQVDVSGASARFDATVMGCTFGGAGAGQSAMNMSSTTGQGTFRLENNVATVRAAVGINVAVTGSAALTGTIKGNSLSTSVTNNPAQGINIVEDTSSGTIVVNVENNTINGSDGGNRFDYGIRAGARAGTGSVHITLKNNTVFSAKSAGTWLFAGNNTGGETARTCVNFSTGNTIRGDTATMFADYFLEQYTGTTFNIQGLTGSGANQANVETFVGNTDLAAGSPNVSAGLGTTVNYTNATCTTAP